MRRQVCDRFQWRSEPARLAFLEAVIRLGVIVLSAWGRKTTLLADRTYELRATDPRIRHEMVIIDQFIVTHFNLLNWGKLDPSELQEKRKSGSGFKLQAAEARESSARRKGNQKIYEPAAACIRKWRRQDRWRRSKFPMHR